jgi:hypothetical protein
MKTATNPHNMTKAELRQWAINLCNDWNWNAGIMEIAKELQDQGIHTESREFEVLTKEFNKFFKKPEMPCIEAVKHILEYNE